jgi:hypothetical protein
MLVLMAVEFAAGVAVAVVEALVAANYDCLADVMVMTLVVGVFMGTRAMEVKIVTIAVVWWLWKFITFIEALVSVRGGRWVPALS